MKNKKRLFGKIFTKTTRTSLLPVHYVDKNNAYKRQHADWHLDKVFVGFEYDRQTQQKIQAFKYHGNPEILQVFLEFPEEELLSIGKDTILTYVPMHPVTCFLRGGNHGKKMAKTLNKNLQLILRALFRKTKISKRQARLSLSERKTNLRDAFGVRSKFLKEIQGRNIIIVDDVISSGTTLNELACLCKNHGAQQVVAICLASGNF